MRSALAVLLLGAVAGACAAEPAPPAVGPLAAALTAAAEQSALPEELLYAVVATEEGFDASLRREIEHEFELPQAGPLHLRHAAFDSLGAAAKIAGVSELELQRDGVLALRAGAEVLARKLAERNLQLAPGVGLLAGEWSDLLAVLGEWSGYADGYHQRDYARRVLAALARGTHTQNRFGELLRAAPIDVPPALLIPEPKPIAPSALPEFEGAEVFPLPANKPEKYEPGRPDGASVEYIVVHDTEGGWDASVATLQNGDSTSVHYIIGRDGRIAQFLGEEHAAKHTGNVYYNRRSIGIEHVGYSTQHYPEPLYEKSAELVRHLAAKYQVPKDRAHIIGHDQVPADNKPNDIATDAPPCDKAPAECAQIRYYGGRNHHTDPGVWEWGVFMHRIDGAAKCNDVTARMACDTTLKFAAGCLDGEQVSVRECHGGCREATDEFPLECRRDPMALDGGPSNNSSSSGGGEGPEEDGGAGSVGSSGSSGSTSRPRGDGGPSGGADQGASDGGDPGGCQAGARAPSRGGWWLALALLAQRRLRRAKH